MTREEMIEDALSAFAQKRAEFERFRLAVVHFFELHPPLNVPPFPAVHSVKSRLKDPDHLRGKLARKWKDEEPIGGSNIFDRVTDLCGVRVFHLHSRQFPLIHLEIMAQVRSEEWVLAEAPIAYSWDPESSDFYKKLGIEPQIKESSYTSIHYVVKPKKTSPLSCEIQVRTLFEEVWGEVDHAINYPLKTTSRACSEQIRVLAKLVGTGTRLVDSIFSSHEEHSKSS